MNPNFLVKVVKEEIDPLSCYDFLTHPNCGAVNLFLGTVRQFTDKKRTGILADQVEISNEPGVDLGAFAKEAIEGQGEPEVIHSIALDYDCYEPFAVAEMQRLLQRASEKWPVVRGLMIHRVGRLELGQASIAVGISSPHRKATFEACDALVDWAKQSVPIWKREILADGTNQWIHPEFPNERKLYHGRVDLGRLEPGEIPDLLLKKKNEIQSDGVLRVHFSGESQKLAVEAWNQKVGAEIRPVSGNLIEIRF